MWILPWNIYFSIGAPKNNDNLWKFYLEKLGIAQFVKNFPLENNPLHSSNLLSISIFIVGFNIVYACDINN